MAQLPPSLAATYRSATTREVHSWSFGRLTAVRRPDAENWEQQLGTLDDQRIFGPLQDFACACGRYDGRAYQGMICDRCGVKVTTQEARRSRFGHIDLAEPVPHPWATDGEPLVAVPVLPAAFVRSTGGEPLAALYDRLIGVAAGGTAEEMLACLDQLFAILAPVVVVAHEWGLRESPTLARGLALEPRDAPPDERCRSCGYPLAGLDVGVCPGCGRRNGVP
jgi:hypothetical protein